MKRRDVLKSAGCALMLPVLQSFGQEAKGDDSVKANRLFCMKISKTHLTYAGMGESKLFDPRNPTSGVNRRAEFWNLSD